MVEGSLGSILVERSSVNQSTLPFLPLRLLGLITPQLSVPIEDDGGLASIPRWECK